MGGQRALPPQTDFTMSEMMEREDLNFLLQNAPMEEINGLCDQIKERAAVKVVQKPTPQTLMVPVKDPINGGEFLGGEVLVTSAIVQVDGNNGWAMVMDDSSELALHLAIIDGAFGAGIAVDDIVRVGELGRWAYNTEKEKLNGQVASTRVAFDLL